MEIKVNNRIEILNPTDDVVIYAKNYLVVNNPEYDNALRMGFWTGGIDKELTLFARSGDKLILPFGCLKDIFEYAKLHNVVVTSEITPFIANKGLFEQIELYNYQQEAVSMLTKAKNGVLEAPCGSGKTQIGIALIKKLGGKALWLTHTRDLLNQSMARAKRYFPNGDFGTITGGKVNIGEDITFATVQTMCNVSPDLYRNEFAVVIVDECHKCVGSPTKMKMFYKVVDNVNCRHKYGLTATPKRQDGLERAMFACLGGLVHKIKQSELGNVTINAIHSPVMIDYRYHRDEYCQSDGTIDFGKMITMLSLHKERNFDIVGNIIYNKQRKQLVLCHRVAQVEIIARMLQERTPDLSVSIVIGATSKKKRVFNADVIVSTYALAKEGLDIPELEVLHLATPQKERTTVIQCVGRIERNIEGKKTPVVYDYVDQNITYCNNAFMLRKRYIKNKNKK